MLYFFILVNNKLDVVVQSLTKIIVYDTKCAFKNFILQSVIEARGYNLRW